MKKCGPDIDAGTSGSRVRLTTALRGLVMVCLYILKWETTFVTSCLLPWATNSFYNGVYSQEKEICFQGKGGAAVV